jgi:hypothetical protein
MHGKLMDLYLGKILPIFYSINATFLLNYADIIMYVHLHVHVALFRFIIFYLLMQNVHYYLT